MFPSITFSLKSANKKTGRIPVSISPSSTCPDACPFKQSGCYAKYWPMAMHWSRVEANGKPWDLFIAMVRNLPDGQLWRHNSAGDLAGENGQIDATALGMLIEANRGKRGFTYTHKPLTRENRALIAAANLNGFTINVSLNSLRELDAIGLGALPVAVVIPERTEEFKPREIKTAAGNQVIVCPAQYRETTCAECGLCARADRKFAIGFHAHGQDKKRVSLRVVQ